MDFKRCKDCGEEKPLDGFYRATRSKDRHMPRCKPCHKIHLEHLRRQAGADGGTVPNLSPKNLARFWGNVVKGSHTYCWEWQGHMKASGGVFSAQNEQFSARRLAYMLKHQERFGHETIIVPTCQNIRCVNPSHGYAQSRSAALGDGTKICGSCHKVKPLEAFHKCVSASSGVFAYCRECNREKKREYGQRPEVKARLRIRRAAKKYDLTVEEYKAMVLKQDDRCMICRKPGNAQGLGVDHCHKTNVIRDLLCTNCNAGIAMFAHDPALIRIAADYCERWNAVTSSSKSQPSSVSSGI